MLSNDETDFESAMEKSNKLIGKAGQKEKVRDALKIYRKCLSLFLKNNPKFVIEKEDFLPLNWRITFDSNQTERLLKHLSILSTNYSLAYTKKCEFLLALQYARFSVWCDKTSPEANFRLFESLKDLLYFNEAHQQLVKMQEQRIGNQLVVRNAIEEVLKEIELYSKPEKVVQLFKRGSDSLKLNDEQAYIGPIQFLEIPGKSRGIRAIRNIKKGEVLLIDKGFISSNDEDYFLSQLCEHLSNKEGLKALYMDLFPSDEYPLPSDSELINEQSPIDEILADNFSIKECVELRLKLKMNKFTTSPLGSHGIFPRVSYFNHSCYPNAEYYFNKDMALLVAYREIAKGEEVTIDYTAINADKEARQKGLTQFQFQCTCDRCQNNVPNDDEYKCLKRTKECRDPNIPDLSCLNQTEVLEKKLEEIKKGHSRFCNCYVKCIWVLAISYAHRRDETNFHKYFYELAELSQSMPHKLALIYLSGLFPAIQQIFRRDPIEKELRVLCYHGFSVEIAKGIWDDYKVNNYQGGFFM